MRVFLMFFAMGAIFADSVGAFETRLRIKNNSKTPATFAVSLTRYVRSDRFGRWWPFLGHIGAKRFIEKGDEKSAEPIKPGALSPWLKLPTSGVCVHITQKSLPPSKTIDLVVDVEILDKGKIVAKRTVPYKRSDTDRMHLITYSYPVTGERKYSVRTAEELTERNLEIADTVLKEFKSPKTCDKIILYSDWDGRGIAKRDYQAMNDAHLDLFKKLGLNGLRCADFPWMKKNGIKHLKIGGAAIGVSYDVKKARRKIRSQALSLIGRIERYDMFDNIAFMKLADEIQSGPFDAFLNYPKAPELIVSEMRKMGLSEKDAGLKQWSDLKLLPPAILKRQNPRLFYWANIARMRILSDCWKATMKLHHKYNPGVRMSPNWPLGGILNGGYQGEGWDQWMIYRDKSLNFNWGEDWTGYQWALNGITSFLVDMMRSQSKDLPMGIYNVAEVGHTPMFVHFKAYAELIRGISQMEFYTYGPIRAANESIPWALKEDMVAEIGRIARETAIAEPYLVETKLTPAKTAMLWTTSQQIWNPDRQQGSFIALYYALLHSNHNIDIISNYDIDDDLLAAYKVLYLPYEYVKSSAWSKIEKWTLAGGTLILCDPRLRNEYNEKIDISKFIPGFQVETKNDCETIGRLPLEFPQKPRLDKTTPVEFPVVCFKSNLTPPKDASVILRYSDGKTAAFKSKTGKGNVVVYGFQPGLSYVWDQSKRDKTRWNANLIFQGFSKKLSDFVTAPIRDAGVNKVCEVDHPTVVVRERRGKSKTCLALFDYSFGVDKPVPPRWKDVGETTVSLIVSGEYNKTRSLKGEILSSRVKDGKTFIKLKFKAIDMILLDK